ncbi:hypothetical protein BSKO_01326 [Bryopsis sp. KO-2023]|nr:hypothetical protein BSKO_01326 [Bryopsis sp. KO-2023]
MARVLLEKGPTHGRDFFMRALAQLHMSHSELVEAKSVARTAVKSALKSLTRTHKAQESSAICSAVTSSPWFKQCKNLGVYVHCDRLNEVDTSPIIQEALATGKTCFVPIVGSGPREMNLVQIESLSDLRPVPPFNILEPEATHPDSSSRQDSLDVDGGLDVLVMPGLAFDRSKNRLGRGGGYYDAFVSRTLETAKSKGWSPPVLVALAFKCQLQDSIPMGVDDRRVDLLATQDGLF